MNKYALMGVLAGVAALGMACLCAPVSMLPFIPTQTLLSPTLAPSATFTLVPPTETPTLAPTLEEQPGEVSSTCITNLAEELHTSETVFRSGQKWDSNYTLVTYRVDGDEIYDPVYNRPIPPDLKPFQQDAASQTNLWKFFANIIPLEQRTQVTGFVIFTDGPGSSLGAVQQGGTPHEWTLEMDIEDGSHFAELSSTLVHEFAHLLTLNDLQVTPDLQVFNHPDDQQMYERAAAQCPTYFLFEGCARAESYLNRFFDTFWNDLYDEWLAIDSLNSSDTQEKMLDDFYWQHRNQFVSSYAVTSPAEDIAESFMYFIFTPRPSGANTSQQKILFFYDFPELASLREQILSHLCTYVEKP